MPDTPPAPPFWIRAYRRPSVRFAVVLALTATGTALGPWTIPMAVALLAVVDRRERRTPGLHDALPLSAYLTAVVACGLLAVIVLILALIVGEAL